MHKYIYRIVLIFFLFSQQGFSKSLEKIFNDEYIRVGVKFDYKPFGFINGDGKLDGFEIDLIKSMMDRINIRVKFIEVSSKNKEKMLLENKVDILIASMIERESKDIIFTKPYFFDEQIALVNNINKLNSLKDLKDLHIGSIKGTTHLENFLKVQPNVTSVTFTEYPQLVKALSSHNIDAITADASWAKVQVENYHNKFKIINDVISINKYSIAVKSDNIKLKENLDFLLNEITRDKIYDKIYKKWF